jgi:hypothetical protein
MASTAAYTVCSSTRPWCRPPPVAAICGPHRATASSSRDARQASWAVLPGFPGGHRPLSALRPRVSGAAPGVVGPNRAARGSSPIPRPIASPEVATGAAATDRSKPDTTLGLPGIRPYDPGSEVPRVIGRTRLPWISRPPRRGDHTRPPKERSDPGAVTDAPPWRSTRRTHKREGHSDGPCAAGGWRNPPMALLRRPNRTGYPSSCRTIRANRYSLVDPDVPSTVQAYQSAIPRMTQTALASAFHGPGRLVCCRPGSRQEVAAGRVWCCGGLA